MTRRPGRRPRQPAPASATRSSITFNPLTLDTDPFGYALTITGVTGSAHANVSFTGSSIIYTPLAGYAGADSFTYTISDGHGGVATGLVNVAAAP